MDFDTRQPLAGASITFTCSIGANIEGERVLRTISRVTGPDGAYTFSLVERFGCQFERVMGSMPGYLYWGSNDPADYMGREIPSEEYFVTPASAIRKQFERTKAEVNQLAALQPEARDSLYGIWLRDFRKAKGYVANPSDEALLRDTYCASVTAAHDRLTPGESEARARTLARQDLDAATGRWMDTRVTDYDFYIVPVCGMRGAKEQSK